MKLKLNNTNNPLMKFAAVADYYSVIKAKISELSAEQNVLDIGGGRGKTFKAGVANYYVLDLSIHNDETFLTGNITSKDLNLDKKFDIIVSKDTFEHILNPWDATDNVLILLN